MKIERVKVIYDEISQYEIKLVPDPRSLGPAYLQDVIATCRNFLNAVSRLQLEVHREKQDLARSLRAAEAEFTVAFDHALSNDERVRRLPSIEDRKSTVNVMLRPQLDIIAGLKAQLHDLEYVEKAIRHRHKELTSSMGDIKLQRSLIRDEMDSGAMYGDERLPEHERHTGKGPLEDTIDMGEIDALFEADAAARVPVSALSVVETAPETPSEVAPEPLVTPTRLSPAPTEEEVIEAFLENPAKQAETDEYAEILANL